ncbi:MAG: hypothetical protein LLF96_05585 [Eubacteriales bacterium]|nr:hypothetical protein [Eubacteriales bacterium]
MVTVHPWIRLMQQSFTPTEQALLGPYLNDVRARIDLHPRFIDSLMEDHVRALRWYADHGVPVSDGMKRLDPAQLGDFYLRERTAWYPLDTAAKIYPLSMGLKRMTMYRLSFYLKYPVEPEILQMALTYTIRRFPYFATTIKCGLFWHYIDSAMRRFAARPETKTPCAPICLNASSSPTFRVVWYQNRVGVEFFHVLTDGTGATIFLRTLLHEYLRLLGYDTPLDEGIFSLTEAPDPREWVDDFSLADERPAQEGFGHQSALQLRRVLTLQKSSRILHFDLPLPALREAAKERNVTVTTLILSLMMLALKPATETHGGKRKIHIQLPVNMRKYYPSHTLRNFSMYCSISMHPRQITTLENILPEISAQVSRGTSKENLDGTMTLSSKLVRYLRFVPLIIKRPIAYLLYGRLSNGVFTTAFSNLGLITLPEGMRPHVEKFDAVLGPPIRNRLGCSLCSYGEHAMFTIVESSAFPVFENVLYDQLCALSLTPYVEGTA